MKTLLLTLILILSSSGTPWADTTYVRDASGRMIQSQDSQGDKTQVRDPDGRTTETWDYGTDGKVVRDQYGRIIRTERDR
jgi:YD repeat-containing protein